MSDNTINHLAVLGYYVGLLAVIGCGLYCLAVLTGFSGWPLRDPPPPPPPPGPGRPCLSCGAMNGQNATHCTSCGRKL